MKFDTDNDYLASQPDKPKLVDLLDDYDQSFSDFRNNSMEKLDDIRFTRWPGQTDDGKKHDSDDKQAFPWEGASDSRINLVDEIINWQVDLCMAAFARAEVKVVGIETGDTEGAGARQTLLKWLKDNALFNDLQREAELHIQYMGQYGYSVLGVGYRQETSLRIEELTYSGLVALAEAVTGSGSLLEDLPNLVNNAEADDQTAELLISIFPYLKKSKAKRVVRDLRDTGRSEFPAPYVSVSRPEIVALRPKEEIIFPPETTSLQDARVVFRRTWLTETQLRAKEVSEGWDGEWIDYAVKQAGKNYMPEHDYSSGVELSGETLVARRDHLVEVVYAYARRLDENNVPGIYCTIFQPHAVANEDGKEIYAKHELMDYSHGQYPFVELRQETVHRRITDSRSVGDIAFTWQNEMKVQHDAITDNTSLATVPPILTPFESAENYVYGPGVKVPVRAGREPKFMQPPPFPSQSQLVLDMLERKCDQYFGRFRKGEDPTAAQLKQQSLVNKWLHCWTQAFGQALQLFIQYAPPGEYERITGTAAGKDLSQKYDYLLKMDSRDLNPEFLQNKWKAIAGFVLPSDQGGVIDRRKLVQFMLMSIDPTLADELVMDQETATQKMIEEVRDNLISMFTGNEAQYVENDPSAAMKLQLTQQMIMANPKYQEAAQQDQLFQQHLQKYVQNLQMSVDQQENKTIGRLGVQPGGMNG